VVIGRTRLIGDAQKPILPNGALSLPVVASPLSGSAVGGESEPGHC
jgi:hypothetical protein